MKKILKITAIVIVLLTVILFVALGGYWLHNLHWYDKYQNALDKVGAEEKQFTLPNGNIINYGEVQNDKPALLLIHGQISTAIMEGSIVVFYAPDHSRAFLLLVSGLSMSL